MYEPWTNFLPRSFPPYVLCLTREKHSCPSVAFVTSADSSLKKNGSFRIEADGLCRGIVSICSLGSVFFLPTSCLYVHWITASQTGSPENINLQPRKMLLRGLKAPERNSTYFQGCPRKCCCWELCPPALILRTLFFIPSPTANLPPWRIEEVSLSGTQLQVGMRKGACELRQLA